MKKKEKAKQTKTTKKKAKTQKSKQKHKQIKNKQTTNTNKLAFDFLTILGEQQLLLKSLKDPNYTLQLTFTYKSRQIIYF